MRKVVRASIRRQLTQIFSHRHLLTQFFKPMTVNKSSRYHTSALCKYNTQNLASSIRTTVWPDINLAEGDRDNALEFMISRIHTQGSSDKATMKSFFAHQKA
jgi:hypothetical protein